MILLTVDLNLDKIMKQLTTRASTRTHDLKDSKDSKKDKSSAKSVVSGSKEEKLLSKENKKNKKDSKGKEPSKDSKDILPCSFGGYPYLGECFFKKREEASE